MSSEEEVYLNDFNLNVNNANELNGYYKDTVVFLNNTEELYNSYAAKKDELKENKKKIYGEIDLNDRKGYYQNQTQENLEYWHSVLWYSYYFLVIVLILGILFDKSGRSYGKKLTIALMAGSFPFLIKAYQKAKHHIYEKYLKIIIG